MTREDLQQLLQRAEAVDLDWKRDFPPGLIGGSSSDQWERGKATLLKDIVAMANGISEGVGHLVYGVKDSAGEREVLGKSLSLDDADLQTWAANTFYPRPVFAYEELAWADGLSLGIVTVKPCPDYPHVTRSDAGGVLRAGQVWFRRGSQNSVAMYDDLKRMFGGDEPIADERLSGPIVTETIEFYKAMGREVVVPRWNGREGKLREGYEFAHFPGTRRLVVVIPYGMSQPDAVLMLKPADPTP